MEKLEVYRAANASVITFVTVLRCNRLILLSYFTRERAFCLECPNQ